MPRTTFVQLWDTLPSEGVVCITAAELARRAEASLGATYRAAHAARAARRIVSPAKGFYVLVPPEYRAWGTVPPEWYLHDLMAYWGRNYYLGFLSAAAWHGLPVPAGHPVQVVTDRPIRGREVEGTGIRVVVAADLESRALTTVPGPTGSLRVAAPETLLLDLAERPEEGGGLAAVLQVVARLPFSAPAILEAARRRPRSVVRRAGWLLETAGVSLPLEPLRELAQPLRSNPTLLFPRRPPGGGVDRRWGVRVNVEEGPGKGQQGGHGPRVGDLGPPAGPGGVPALLPLPSQDLAAWRGRVPWRDDRLVALELLAFLLVLRVAADPYLGTRLAWVGREAYERLDLLMPNVPVDRVVLAPIRETDPAEARARLRALAADLGSVAEEGEEPHSGAADGVAPLAPAAYRPAPSASGPAPPPGPTPAEGPPCSRLWLVRRLVVPPVPVGLEVELRTELLRPRHNPRRIRKEARLRLWQGEAWILTLAPEELAATGRDG